MKRKLSQENAEIPWRYSSKRKQISLAICDELCKSIFSIWIETDSDLWFSPLYRWLTTNRATQAVPICEYSLNISILVNSMLWEAEKHKSFSVIVESQQRCFGWNNPSYLWSLRCSIKIYCLSPDGERSASTRAPSASPIRFHPNSENISLVPKMKEHFPFRILRSLKCLIISSRHWIPKELTNTQTVNSIGSRVPRTQSIDN